MSEEVKSQSEKKKEDWMNAKWRPMMGWMYMLVCTVDFVAFPVLWSLVQTLHGGNVTTQWSPITLQGAGLFHMAMGAILGIAAFGRTQEKLAGANNGGITAPGTFNGVTPVHQPTPVNSYTPQPVNAPGVTYSSTGKAMPEQPLQPAL